MFKFIHAADIHLDSPLLRLGQYDDAPAETLRLATRQSLINLVDLAIDEQVQFLIIAGDVYDGDWDDIRTGLFMVQQMTRLRDAEIPVFLIAGNHDAATRMTHNVRYPDNVHVFGHRKAETRRLDEIGVALHGQSFAKHAVTENLARNYPPAVPNLFNIGILHTSLTGREGHENYAPCTLEDLIARQYDYWALGHIHQRELLHDDPLVAYSGNLQGRNVREVGPKGALLVTVRDNTRGRKGDGRASDGPRVEHEFRPLDAVRWLRVELDVSQLNAPEGLLDLARSRLDALRREEEGRTLAVRLEVVGRSTCHEQLAGQAQRWDDELRAIAVSLGDSRSQGELWLEKIQFRTRPALTPGGETPDGPLAEVSALVAEYLSNDESLAALADELRVLRDKLPDELRYGVEPLKVESPEFLRRIVSEVEPLLRQELRGGAGGDA